MPDYAPPQISLPPVIPADPFTHVPETPPPPGAPPVPPPPAPAKEKLPRRRQRWFLIIGLVAVVLAIGGGAFGFYFWQQQQAQPIATPTPTPTPTVSAEQLLQQAWAAWSAVKSYHAGMRVTVETTAIEGTKYAAEMQQSGFSDLKFSASLDATTDVSMAEPPQGSADIKFTIPLGTSLPVFANEVITPELWYLVLDKNTMYFKIDNLPILAKVGWDGLTGQWVKVDAAMLTSTSTAGMTPLLGPDSAVKEYQQQMGLTSGIYRQYPFLTTERVEGSETIDNMPTVHIKIGFKHDVFKQFYAALYDQVLKRQMETTGVRMGTTTPEEVYTAVSEVVDTLQLSGDVWLGQSDNLMRQVRMSVTATPKEQGIDQGTVTVGVDAQFSKLNEPVVVTAPAESIPLQEYVGLIMAKVSGMMVSNLRIDSDGDGLQDEQELRLGTDPQKKDTDGDGYEDGTEVKNGYNPLGQGAMSEEMKLKAKELNLK